MNDKNTHSNSSLRIKYIQQVPFKKIETDQAY